MIAARVQNCFDDLLNSYQWKQKKSRLILPLIIIIIMITINLVWKSLEIKASLQQQTQGWISDTQTFRENWILPVSNGETLLMKDSLRLMRTNTVLASGYRLPPCRPWLIGLGPINKNRDLWLTASPSLSAAGTWLVAKSFGRMTH